MGAVKRILITGANGFVGRAAVREARAQGLDVIALYRRNPLPEWADDPAIFSQQTDLSDPESADLLRDITQDVQAVIHAAAHLGDDPARHAEDTLRATETVLATLSGTEATLVLVSSIAVYDTMALKPGDQVTETSPLESPDKARDAYAEAKLRQEELCAESGHPLWIMRPGAVYGPSRSWHALLGFWASKFHVQINSEGQLPLVHVDHLAKSLVAAALAEPPGILALNVVDDDLPTRARFLAAHRKLFGWPKLTVPIRFGLWLSLARLLARWQDRLPGLLREPVLRARVMPLDYPNVALRSALGGADEASFEVMLAKCKEGEA